MTTVSETTSTVTLRPATPADVDFLAWASLTAARSHVETGIWEAFLGWDEERTLDYIRRVLVSDVEHWVHWTRFDVADVDGQPAAALCSYDPTTHGFEPYMGVATALAAELMTPAEMEAAMTRGELIASCMSDEPANAWVIENVATRPEFRRRGLVDRLLTRALDRGRDLGFEIAQISVFLGNEPARACYIKHGFAHVDEKRSLEFEALMGFPGIERLQRAL
jgi:translation initiation factor 4G